MEVGPFSSFTDWWGFWRGDQDVNIIDMSYDVVCPTNETYGVEKAFQAPTVVATGRK